MARPDCPDKIKADYQKYCNEHTQWWSDTGLSDDRRTYNHFEIRERLNAASIEIKDTKEKLLDAIEKDITYSIAPVNNKRRR